MKIMKYNKICNISKSITVLNEFIPIIVDMVQKKLVSTFNLVNPKLISYDEILWIYNKIIHNGFTIEEPDKILNAIRRN